MISEAERKLSYPISLLLSTDTKKTAESLAKVHNKSRDTMLRRLEYDCVTLYELVKIAIIFFASDHLYLIIDDTTISKRHSKCIEGSCDNYDSSTGRTQRSICSVTVMLSNGRVALPIHHSLWVQKEIAGSGYKTKIEIAQDLIGLLSRLIRIKGVIIDGLYSSKKMIRWLDQRNIKFEMRFHSNRVITEGPDKKKVKVREHKKLQLRGKRKARTVSTTWDDIPVYVTAIKRVRKNSTIIVYQVSNAKMSARDHIRIYGYRWKIEMFFRTAKQSLGLTHCQSRKRVRQEHHIYNVFFAYIMLQFERKKRRLKTPEDALRKLKLKGHLLLKYLFAASDQIFQVLRGAYA